MNAPHFKYYLDGQFVDRPEPMFGLWMENAKGFSDVCGETVLAAGLPLPLFPDYKTWKNEVASKRRCGRCWRVTRGGDDLARHNEISHLNSPAHFPQGVRREFGLVVMVLLGAFMFSACNTLKKDFLHPGEDKPKADNSPYVQFFTGRASGEVTDQETVAFTPNKVTAFWSQYKNQFVNGHNETGCTPIGPQSQIDQFAVEQPGRAWPYAVVSVNGLVVTVQFKGMGHDDGCWAFKSDPNVVASSDLY